ncbi:MAG: hypothetical protein QW165_01780 [Candidatus Woesearchaeota archaeon]
MSLIDDWKALKWPGKLAVIASTLIGLGSTTYGAYALRTKPLEDQVANAQPGEKDGKKTYTFKINDNQRKGYTVTFSNEQAFKRFNNFVENYIVDHEQELEGRDYLTPSETWQLVKLIDNKSRPSTREITNVEMADAENGYKMNKRNFAIQFDFAESKNPKKKFDLGASVEEEYNHLEADQDKYLEMCRNKIRARQERIHKLWNAAEATYWQDLRSNADYQRAKAEFRHYRR